MAHDQVILSYVRAATRPTHVTAPERERGERFTQLHAVRNDATAVAGLYR